MENSIKEPYRKCLPIYFHQEYLGASLLTEKWRILPMQETWVRLLIQEDPVSHMLWNNWVSQYWALLWSQGATATEPAAATTEAHLP